MFKGKLLGFLKRAFAQGKLHLNGQLKALADPPEFQAWLDQLRTPKWVVYAKPPLAGPDHVLKYLARYTHRVAISNGRLVSLIEDRVSFRWRDSQDGKRLKVMTLEAVEFIRRFLLHILPTGFVKIRHFGFLSNRNRAQALRLCRHHLHSCLEDHPIPDLLAPERRQAMEHRCPRCAQGTLHTVARLSPEELVFYNPPGSRRVHRFLMTITINGFTPSTTQRRPSCPHSPQCPLPPSVGGSSAGPHRRAVFLSGLRLPLTVLHSYLRPSHLRMLWLFLPIQYP